MTYTESTSSKASLDYERINSIKRRILPRLTIYHNKSFSLLRNHHSKRAKTLEVAIKNASSLNEILMLLNTQKSYIAATPDFVHVEGESYAWTIKQCIINANRLKLSLNSSEYDSSATDPETKSKTTQLELSI